MPQVEELPFEEARVARVFKRPVEFFDPQPTSRRELPDPHPWTTRFVQAVLEALVGRRPVAQLQEWTSAPVLSGIAQAAGGRRWARFAGTRPTIRSVRVSEPVDGVAEVSAVVQRGERCCAVAARLEGLDGRWRCTALQVG
jgi:Family of unknown function (DUF6459)